MITNLHYQVGFDLVERILRKNDSTCESRGVFEGSDLNNQTL